MQLNTVFIKPVVTEKGTQHSANNVFMFEVHENASKTIVKEAIETLYKVKVGTVRVMRRKGKVRRVGRRMISKPMPDKKIALIKITEGNIDLFPKA